MTFTPRNSEETTGRVESVLSLSQGHLASIGYRLREAVLEKFNRENESGDRLRFSVGKD